MEQNFKTRWKVFWSTAKQIQWKNFWIWFKDQMRRKTWFRNFFITGNAWGAFSLNSHINQHTGQPKITYNHLESAQKAADKMGKKHNTHFSVYKCIFCDGYHIGKNRENKTEYDRQVITDVKVEDHTLKMK